MPERWQQQGGEADLHRGSVGRRAVAHHERIGRRDVEGIEGVQEPR
jgi:hypothetical protein